MLGLLLERYGQGLNLIFLQSDPCRLLFSRSLQLLDHLTLFDHFFQRKRTASSGGTELAVSVYDNRVTAHAYTGDALDKACTDEAMLADADGLAFVAMPVPAPAPT